MQLDQLKQGFFGYKKADVCQYITSLEVDYSRQLAEFEKAAKVQEAEYQARIQNLELELQERTKRYEEQLQTERRIASTLQEAEHYAEVLHNEAQVHQLQEQEVWQKQLDKKNRQLQRYQDQISSLRDLFHTLLCSMKTQICALLQQAESIKDTCPDRHMALFERTSDLNSELQERCCGR